MNEFDREILKTNQVICDNIALFCVNLGKRGEEAASARGEWEVKFLHISRGGGGVLGSGSGAQNGPIFTRKSPKSTRNSPVLTQIGPGLARKSPGRPVAGSGEHGEEFFGLLNFCCTRQTLFYLGRFFRFPPPTPSRCYSMCGRGPCRNGRGISNFKII